MRRAKIEHLHAVAKQRAPGYLEACRREGKISPDGRWIFFSDESHARLRQQYNHLTRTIPLGDLVHKVAGPIGRALRWPCMKGDGSTDLKPGSPCDRARRALNALRV